MQNKKSHSIDNQTLNKPAGSRWLKSAWKDCKPILLGILGGCTLILGTIGFQQNELSLGHPSRWIDSFIALLLYLVLALEM